MPRPTHQDQITSQVTQSKNPFKNLMANRKEKRRLAAEQAAKLASNGRAEAENTIIEILEGINFIHSPIPKEILEHKDNPAQQYGDLELGAKAIVSMIKKAPNISYDISDIDAKLIHLATNYKDAVQAGNVRAAYAAKGALVACINNIRHKLPSVNEEYVKGYIEKSIEYIETWVQLVYNSIMADELERNVNMQQKKNENDIREQSQKLDQIEKEINNNPNYLVAVDQIRDKNATSDPTEWTEDMRKVRKMLVDQKISKLNMNLTYRSLQSMEIELRKREGNIDTLRAAVANMPIPTDPNEDAKFKEQLDKFIKELDEMDTDIDNMLTLIEDVEGQLQILDNAPGAAHLRNAVAEQADKVLSEIAERQERELSGQGVSKERMMKKLGIKSMEEVERLKEQAEAENQKIINEAINSEYNTNDEANYNYDTE